MDLKKLLPVFIVFILIYSGCASLHQASSTGDIGILKYCLEQGADVNARDENGMTPLMSAARSNHTDIIKILLEKGADINLKDNKGKAALDHAFDPGNFNAFKILLENGASSRININKRIADSNPEKQFYKLLKEYRLYKLISRNNSVDNFDAYFSQFSKGYYTSAVENIFKNFIKADYEQAVSKSSPEKIKNFIRKYSSMGKNYFLVNTGSLNIRSGPSVDTDSRGSYYRGDRIYAIKAEEGWIQTERGWISRDFVKPIFKIIPFVQPYIKKAAGLVEKDSPPPAVQPRHKQIHHKEPAFVRPKQKIKPVPAAPHPEQKPESGFAAVEKELKNLMKNANLKNLEAFIKKYSNKNEYRSLVNTAREKYKSILLGN